MDHARHWHCVGMRGLDVRRVKGTDCDHVKGTYVVVEGDIIAKAAPLLREMTGRLPNISYYLRM
jgi:hypothetical protein